MSKPTLESRSNAELQIQHKRLTALKTFETEGKVSFKSEHKGGIALVYWRQEEDHYNIQITTVLGSHAIYLSGVPGRVRLKQSNGEILKASSPEALIKETLGWDIPVSGLLYWIKGVPAPHDSKAEVVYDNLSRLKLLKQNNWSIHYESYSEVNGLFFPKKMTLENGPIKIKLLFNHWSY